MCKNTHMPKPFASRRGPHASQPEDIIRLNVLIPHLDPMLVHFLDMDTRDDLDALLFQLLLYFCCEFRAELRQGPWCSLHEDKTGVSRSNPLEVALQNVVLRTSKGQYQGRLSLNTPRGHKASNAGRLRFRSGKPAGV